MQHYKLYSPVYATDGEFLSSPGDAGFVLALPLHNNVGGVPEDHVAGHIWLGAYA